MSYQLPTPIPLGSPYLDTPPMLDRWGVLGRDAKGRDQRIYERKKVACDLWLVEIASNYCIRCRTSDISDAGVFATAPIGFGLGVGQRYEIRIASTPEYSSTSARLAPSLGYGTVIRHEVDVTGNDSHRVGLAIRFDVPQLIPV